jgi:hypothetical protein
VCDSVLAGLVIAVEVRYLSGPITGLRRPMRVIADDLNSWRISILPVLHLDDCSEQLADAGHAAEIHRGTAVLRLGSDTHDPDGEEADKALARLHDRTGLPTGRCHLLLDLFEVCSERDLTKAEPVVRKWMSWAQRYPWKSITVAAGAMQATISHIPFLTPTALPRWDFQLWQRVAGLGVQYADHGTAHPAMTGTKWLPKPNLRYTDDEKLVGLPLAGRQDGQTPHVRPVPSTGHLRPLDRRRCRPVVGRPADHRPCPRPGRTRKPRELACLVHLPPPGPRRSTTEQTRPHLGRKTTSMSLADEIACTAAAAQPLRSPPRAV